MYQKIGSKNKIRVCLVDDHAGVRFEIGQLLAADPDIIVDGEGATGADAIELVSRLRPDILLLDVELPVMRGDEVVAWLRGIFPEVKILAISSYDDPGYIMSMLENGAVGYITKDEAPHLLLDAIHSVMNDRVKWISSRVAEKVSRVNFEDKTFTGRELEILRLLVLGKSDEDICLNLEIDQNLLNRHLDLLKRKFNVTSREGLREAAQGVISTADSAT